MSATNDKRPLMVRCPFCRGEGTRLTGTVDADCSACAGSGKIDPEDYARDEWPSRYPEGLL
jgi:DnaJ-class molecular chaperone